MGSKPASRLKPGLYIVATPIGHADDISLRALDVLGSVSRVACEDTRTTGKLLARHGIHTKLIPYHEHNAESMRPALLARLEHGETIALVSDAGTPLISDPGYKLVRTAINRGLNVTSVPGPSAPIMALTLSGLPSDRFFFAGFLPTRPGARRKALSELSSIPATLLILEAPHRLAKSLADMAEILGARPAAVARELTKLYEEVRRANLDDLARHYAEAGAPKGEIVVIIGPPEARPAAESWDAAEIDDRLKALLETHSVREAAAALAAETGMPRRTLYARAVALSKDSP